MIEKLRQTGIRLDREGRFWHEGAEVTHEGFRRALLRWIDRLDDGRPIIRLDGRRFAYIDVEDAHLLAVSARWEGDRVFLTLNDGCSEELDYASLRVDQCDHALYCAVRGGRLEARITTAAYYVLAERIEPASGVEHNEPGEAFVLHARGRTFFIAHRELRPSVATP